MKILKKISKKLCQVARLLHYIRETRKENQGLSQQNEEFKKENYRFTIENKHLVDYNIRLEDQKKKLANALRLKAIELEKCRKQLSKKSRNNKAPLA